MPLPLSYCRAVCFRCHCFFFFFGIVSGACVRRKRKDPKVPMDAVPQTRRDRCGADYR